LHFAGRFQAAPSTVNNDPNHFNNATFQEIFQTPGPGLWNPGGDAAWRLIGCRVTGAWLGHEQGAADDDVIRTCLIADSDRAPPAKIVDLDSEQQLVSEIWGLQVRVCLPDGTNLLRATYETAAFSDIWDRAAGASGGDVIAGAMYQSVLTDLEWADVSASPFLTALKHAAGDGLLSIKFNVDGYNMSADSPEFTRGRIVGTIGPASKEEPRHFVVGRHFMAATGLGSRFFAPAGNVNFCTAVVDEQAGKIVLDLGNALQTTSPGGPIKDMGTLALAYLVPATSGGTPPIVLDTFGYTRGYSTTAGIVTVPAGRSLTQNERDMIATSPLVLTATGLDGNTKVVIAEPPNGTYLRADRFVFRLNPGETANVRLFASQYGKPYKGAGIISVADPSQLQPAGPPVAVPPDVIDFPPRLVADASGVAELKIRCGDPKGVRRFIDGQVYGVRSVIEDDIAFGAGYNLNPWEFVSLLAWSGFAEENPPTWHGSIEPIFQQYANLYPVMKRIVDLKDYESVSANVGMLLLAFGLPLENPNSMPVTRDLSEAKRRAILRWLGNPGADGKPLKGVAAPTLAMRAATQAGPSPSEHADMPMRGGKAMAADRRLMLRNRVP
jgi:hypothetical protein